MEKKEYHNVLPSRFTSWAQFFLVMELPSVIMHVLKDPEVNCLQFQMSRQSPETDWLDGPLTIDLDFLKARVFEDILKNSVVTRKTAAKIAVADSVDPDSDQYQEIARALKEIALWGEVISQSRERPRNAFNPFGSMN